MSIHKSVTFWINQLKAGDSVAAQRLWENYFQRMVELARKKLQGAPRAAADEEDVALSAFKSFCLGAREGRFTQLTDSENLWPLLVAITANKSVDLIRRQNRKKRGGTGQASDEAADTDSTGNPRVVQTPVPLSEIISQEPTAEFAAEMAEQLDILLRRLEATGDPELQQIALGKLDGESTVQIAQRLGCVRRTVERKLQLIARLWDKDFSA